MSSYPLLDAFLTMLWFFLWILWLILLFRIIVDIFASRDLGGLGKAGWLIFVIILPFLGVFVYVIARGGKMTERQVRTAKAQDEAFRDYVRETASEGSSADQLAKLADLRERGAITDQEFQKAKAGVLTGKAA
jgi:hypothetical protein